MNFKERVAKKRLAISKKSKPVKKVEQIVESSTRKCGKCGQLGHNARTCSFKPLAAPQKATLAKIPVKIETGEKEQKTLESGQSNLGNRDYLQPSTKEILDELKELLKLKECNKIGRDDIIALEELSKKRIPNKSMVGELKSKMDPRDLVNERYTLKKKLRDLGFRIPSEISTSDLVNLAIKRGVL